MPRLFLPKTPFSGFQPNVTLLHSDRLVSTPGVPLEIRRRRLRNREVWLGLLRFPCRGLITSGYSPSTTSKTARSTRSKLCVAAGPSASWTDAGAIRAVDPGTGDQGPLGSRVPWTERRIFRKRYGRSVDPQAGTLSPGTRQRLRFHWTAKTVGIRCGTRLLRAW